MNEEERAEGAWIFLSHSHKDLEKVREIRNALEAKGQNPLMFFLKCLDDDSELDDLIRREIEARTWFVLCESPNARVSRWVRAEIEIIKRLEGKVYEVIDLDDDLDVQVERVTALSKRATVFISSSRADADIAARLRAALLERDFRAFHAEEDLQPGSDWRAEILEAIDRATAEGFFILLISPEALESQWTRVELEFALRRQAARGGPSNIVPVIVRQRGLVQKALRSRSPFMADRQFFDLTTGDLDERIQALVRSLMTRQME
jgi:TIR domain